LNEFIEQCELNYQLIIQLMPFLDLTRNESLTFENDSLSRYQPIEGSQIEFKMIEKAKYTTTLQLRLNSSKSAAKIAIDLLVRLYHDAKLMEVMDKVGPKALKPVLKGKGIHGVQTDEKRQLNRLLGESLQACLIV
jgi:uncharacterized protein